MNCSMQLVSIHSADERKAALRMQNLEGRRYQLFPKDKQLPPVTVAKPLDPDQAYAVATGQAPDKSDKPEKTGLSNGLLLRIKEHNLTRRRKVSVPELGPMTTVQEVSMDSRKLPSRSSLQPLLTIVSYDSGAASSSRALYQYSR